MRPKNWLYSNWEVELENGAYAIRKTYTYIYNIHIHIRIHIHMHRHRHTHTHTHECMHTYIAT